MDRIKPYPGGVARAEAADEVLLEIGDDAPCMRIDDPDKRHVGPRGIADPDSQIGNRSAGGRDQCCRPNCHSAIAKAAVAAAKAAWCTANSAWLRSTAAWLAFTRASACRASSCALSTSA